MKASDHNRREHQLLVFQVMGREVMVQGLDAVHSKAGNQAGLHSEFQAGQGCTVKPSQTKQKQLS